MRRGFAFSDETTGALLAVAGIFLFSAKAVLVKIAYRYGIDSVSLLALRMIFSMPAYALIAWISLRKSAPQKATAKDYLGLVFAGLVGYYLASYFDFQGLKYISASLERLILFVYPTIVVLISGIVFGKKITANQWLAIFVTYAGILITFAPDIGGEAGGDVWMGSGLIFLSAFTYALFIIGSGNLIPRFGPTLFTALAMMVSCVCVVAHYLISVGSGLLGFPPEIYIIAGSMALFSTVLPSFMVSEAIKRIGSSHFAIIGSFGPVSTIILAVIFIQETLSVYQVIGAAVIIAGISILKLKWNPGALKKSLRFAFARFRIKRY